MRPLAALALTLLVVPVAQADSVIEGALHEVVEMELEGAVRATAHEGFLDLVFALRSGETIVIEGSRAKATIEKFTRYRAGPLANVASPAESSQSVSLGRGWLVVETGQTPQVLALSPADETAHVAVTGRAAGRVATAEEELLRCDSKACVRSPGRTFSAAPGSLLFGGPDHLTIQDPTFEARGRVHLILRDVSATWIGVDGRGTALHAREGEETTAPGIAREWGTRISMTVEDAHLLTMTGSQALLAAPRAEVTGDLAFQAARASGWLRVGGNRLELDHAPLRVEGLLQLGSTTQEDLGRGSSSVTLAGKAGTVLAPGLALSPASSFERAAELSAAAGLVALAALGLRLAIVAAYARIASGRVLENANRARILELIQRTPGATPTDLARTGGLARVVVRHHLAILIAHRAVLRRRDGRLWRYFPPGANWTHSDSILRERSRQRLIVEILAAPGGLTQRELVDRTGLSQRLVSYHLAKLEAAGVVHAVGASPKRYRAPQDSPSVASNATA